MKATFLLIKDLSSFTASVCLRLGARLAHEKLDDECNILAHG